MILGFLLMEHPLGTMNVALLPVPGGLMPERMSAASKPVDYHCRNSSRETRLLAWPEPSSQILQTKFRHL